MLAHYFSDKQDILGSALVLSHRRVGERMDRSAAGLAGLAALRVVMLEALPLDPQRLLEAEIEVSFWGRSLGSPELAALQNAEFERLWSGCARCCSRRSNSANWPAARTSRRPPTGWSR